MNPNCDVSHGTCGEKFALYLKLDICISVSLYVFVSVTGALGNMSIHSAELCKELIKAKAVNR